MVNEHLGDLSPSLEARAMHRCVTILLSDCHVGARLEQCLDRLDFTLIMKDRCKTFANDQSVTM